jgi:hypothetical protein
MNWSIHANRALEILVEAGKLTEDDVASLKGKIEYWATTIPPGKRLTKEYKWGDVTVDVTAKADAVFEIKEK